MIMFSKNPKDSILSCLYRQKFKFVFQTKLILLGNVCKKLKLHEVHFGITCSFILENKNIRKYVIITMTILLKF